MVTAIITLTVFGMLAGLGLAIASKKFFVAKDPKVEAVQECLPGANCGACGFPGCSAMAKAIAEGAASPSGCPVCAPEMVAEIGKIMGIEVVAGEKKVPRLICAGDKEKCKQKAVFADIQDCKVMAGLVGGGKACMYGCLGGGNCVTVCPADALHMNENGLPVVDASKCISCSLCVKECPRALLVMKPLSKKVVVECASKAKGADVRKACSVGCIGCKMCEKVCPEGAITIENNLAVIDPAKCTLCGACVEKCPQKTISHLK